MVSGGGWNREKKEKIRKGFIEEYEKSSQELKCRTSGAGIHNKSQDADYGTGTKFKVKFKNVRHKNSFDITKNTLIKLAEFSNYYMDMYIRYKMEDWETLVRLTKNVYFGTHDEFIAFLVSNGYNPMFRRFE